MSYILFSRFQFVLSSLPLSVSIIATFFSLQAWNLCFRQILPIIIDFWYPGTAFTDTQTGPDLSCSFVYFPVHFSLIFSPVSCGRLSIFIAHKTSSYRIIYSHAECEKTSNYEPFVLARLLKKLYEIMRSVSGLPEVDGREVCKLCLANTTRLNNVVSSNELGL